MTLVGCSRSTIDSEVQQKTPYYTKYFRRKKNALILNVFQYLYILGIYISVYICGRIFIHEYIRIVECFKSDYNTN